ncbi:MAG: patatin-like phospholipase family protein [Desulfosudaceae bacterium]
MTDKLVLYGGRKARAIIQDQGLRPELVQAVTGAAGGPKWLILYELDRFLFGDFFRDRSEPLRLIGSSIGTWRFATIASDDPRPALARLKNAYIRQCYGDKPSPAEVSAVARDILDEVISQAGLEKVLNHPLFYLNIITVRETGPVWLRRGRPAQLAALAGAALGNAVSRKTLRLFFERVVFHHPGDGQFLTEPDDFPVRGLALNKSNIRPAILASGSIPLVMAGVRDIPGAPAGAYRDGGIIDYHLNLPVPCHPDRLVLFPHYMDRVIPGWFDKKIAWRRANPSYLDNVLMVAPRPSFIATLPYGKIPDRKDFVTFHNRNQDRFDYWEKVAHKSRELAEEFSEAVASGRIREMVQPFPD